MNARNFGAALLAVVLTSVPLAAAVPAQADPTDDAGSQQTDAAFLAALKDKKLKLSSDADAIDLAHSTCDVLVRTESVETALRHIQNATKWKNLKDIQNFGGLAVQGYCPKSMPKQ
ncbi:DUF732 domain-containing protein [Mycobacterium yunnanensis]|uniref:DUF732 domain-containing protein n=1 Tax=Mycobacterium yunnanensis TaxID=368477 RepID=A0A9X3BRJ6_9MYCO|nr:DUF732 domain-containing protein [Mycobacterium yunnanensis]MCV7419015.1 DUF732 domain-containing protein [Mycobacterium yunnanensis]